MAAEQSLAFAVKTDVTIAPPSQEPLKVRIAPLVVLLMSLAAVVWIPQVAHVQSGGDARVPRSIALGLVAAVVWSCSVAVLYLTWRARALHSGWLLTMVACFLMLATVKFILSPAEYFATGVSLGRVVAVAAGVLVFYLVTILVLTAGVRRTAHGGIVALHWKITMVVVAGVLILAARSAAASLVGASAGQYLSGLFATSFGAILIIALLLTAVLFVQALEYGSKPVVDGSGRTALTATAWISAALLVGYQVLWVILVTRLQ